MAKDRFLRSLKNYRGPRGVRLESTTDEGATEPMTLSLYGVCGQQKSDMFGSYGGDYDANMVAAKLAECGGKPLTLRLNSPGGDAFEGLAIHNLLLDYAGEITVKVDGLAASAASIVAMAGDKVCMGAGAQLMIHRAWSFAAGDAVEMRKMADDLEKTDLSIAKMYAKKMGASEDEVMALMTAETYFTSDEAVKSKLADEMVDEPEAEGEDPEPDPEPSAAEGEPDDEGAEPEPEPEPSAAEGEDDEDVKALLRTLGAPTAKAALVIVQAKADQRRAEKVAKATDEREALISQHAHRMTPRTLASVRKLATLAEVRAVLATLPPSAPRAASRPLAAPIVEPEILTEAEIFVANKAGVPLDKARAEKLRLRALGRC